MRSKVDLYLDAIGRGLTGGEAEDLWPLKPAQISPYYDADQAVEIYEILKNLRETHTNSQIAALFRYPGILRNFLRNAGVIGLKVANKVGMRKIDSTDRLKYFEFLVDLLSKMVKSDPFCLDNRNLILGSEEIKSLVKKNWQPAENNRQTINAFYVSAFSWMWATHFNMFVGAGLEPHGPYDVSQIFGPKSLLLIREFHGAYCPEVWNLAKQLPLRALKIYQVYQGTEIGINFEGQIISEGLGSFLTHYLIQVDEGFIKDMDEIIKIDNKITSLASKQTKLVNQLKPLEQVEKAAQISHFSLRGIYQKAKISYWPKMAVKNNIKRFGNHFLKSLGGDESFSKEYFRIVSDPRNNLLGSDALKAIK